MPAKKTARKATTKSSKKAARPAKRPAAKKAAKPTKRPAKAPAKKAAKGPSKGSATFGRAGTAGKAEGDAPVLAYMETLRPEQRAIMEKVEAIVSKEVPDVKRGMKWSMPFYGREGQGWFLAFASFKDYCALRFFRGTDLDPVPPVGQGKDGRSVNYESVDEIDEKQLRSWIKQAAALPGWGS